LYLFSSPASNKISYKKAELAHDIKDIPIAKNHSAITNHTKSHAIA